MSNLLIKPLALATLTCGLLAACGGDGGDGGTEGRPPVTMNVVGPNAVSDWNEIAATTVNGASSATGTPEEQRPTYAVDMASVSLAIYDALMAIKPTHRPFAVTPTAPAEGASQEAAVAAAAYGVLVKLFPNRAGSYQPAYDSYVANLPDGEGKARGLAIGAQAAAGILAIRVNDGRSVALEPYVPGTQPGQFRGTNPIGRPNPYIKPFVMTSASQFRLPPPPALNSAAYATDFNETRILGGATSTTRTAGQLELARFTTENPAVHWTRNIRRFAMTNGTLSDHARLMAMVWVAHADATIACFDTKYHYQTWRPFTAIALADTDGNDATTADPSWAPVLPTPNHPEYPAAHSCATSSTMEALRAFHGTSQITFDVDSTVSGTTRRYANPTELVDDVATARIAGGMHFRFSSDAGAAQGKNVAQWMASRHFQPR